MWKFGEQYRAVPSRTRYRFPRAVPTDSPLQGGTGYDWAGGVADGDPESCLGT